MIAGPLKLVRTVTATETALAGGFVSVLPSTACEMTEGVRQILLTAIANTAGHGTDLSTVTIDVYGYYELDETTFGYASGANAPKYLRAKVASATFTFDATVGALSGTDAQGRTWYIANIATVGSGDFTANVIGRIIDPAGSALGESHSAQTPGVAIIYVSAAKYLQYVASDVTGGATNPITLAGICTAPLHKHP